MFGNGSMPFSMNVVPEGSGGNNGAWGDGAWFIWIILIFAIWGNWGGNGFGGRDGAGAVENYVLGSDFSMLSRQLSDGFNSQERKLDTIQSGICSLGYDQLAQMNTINTNILTSTSGIQAQLADCCCKTQTGIADVNYNMASQTSTIEKGFADTNYNLATQSNGINNTVQNGFCQLNYNNATNTRDIIDVTNTTTQAILAKLDAMENSRKDEKIAELTAMNNDLRLKASQEAQSNYLVNQLRPCPIPAYLTCNPFAASYGCGTCCQC